MAQKFADRVKETTTTTGTGNVTVAGAVSGYSTFATRYANNDTFYYAIIHQTATEWEVGYGTYVSGTPAVARTKVIASTNSDAAVNFSAGTKHVFVTAPSTTFGVNGAVDPRTFQARLTAQSGNPVPNADVTGATSIYLTMHNGNRISLYNGSFWQEYAISEISSSLSGLIKGVTYDVFVKDVAGVPTLVLYAWKTIVASNNPTAGSSKVININVTADLSVGQRVTVKDGSNSEVAYITAISTNTSITVDVLANSYTGPNVYGFRVREPGFGLTVKDNIWVSQSTGDSTERYAGSITISGTTTGQTEDSDQRRLVYNEYNKVARKLKRTDTTDSWTYSTNAFHQANASAANQVEITQGTNVGTGSDPVWLRASGLVTNSTATARSFSTGIGVDRTTTNDADMVQRGYTPASNAIGASSWAELVHQPSPGFHFFAWEECGNGTDTQTWYGDAGVAGNQYATGLIGTWPC